MVYSLQDVHFMSRALGLAQKGNWQTSPNPMVGAVIVNKGRIIAEGFHRRAGFPHAEIEALQKINFKAHGATLYCNLEPCCHYGKTPPCVEAIIKSGIKRVVISHRDPNPLVSGKSIRILRKSGIRVTSGVMEREAKFLNRVFLTWVQKKRPYIILKAAMSLDGKISPGKELLFPPPRGGRVRERVTPWITGPSARRRVHEIRSRVDAILVGVNTVIADNPRLTVRGMGKIKQPLRIVLDSRNRTPRDSKIFGKGGEVLIACAKNSLKPFLRKLAAREITSLLVEGGSQVYESFLREGLCDEFFLFQSTKILGPKGLSLPPLSSIYKKSFNIDYLSKIGPDSEYHFIRVPDETGLFGKLGGRGKDRKN